MSARERVESTFPRRPLLELRDIFTRVDELQAATLRIQEEQRDLLRKIAQIVGAPIGPPLIIAPPPGPPIVVQVPGALPAPIIPIEQTIRARKFQSYFLDERGISSTNKSPRDIDVLSGLGRPATSGFIFSKDQTITVELNKSGKEITLDSGQTFELDPLDPFEISHVVLRSTAITAAIRIFLV